jgi:hypothetical protein
MPAKIITSLLLVYVTVIIGRGIYLYRERKEYLGYCVRKKGNVFYNEGMLASGILLSAVFSLITAVFAFTGGNTVMTALFAFTSLTFSSLIISFCNCYIIYDNEKITQGIFVGIKREFTYEEITAIEARDTEVHIRAGKKKIRVYADYTLNTKSDFIETVKKRYRAIHGTSLPEVKSFDIFNGYVKSGNSTFGWITVISVILLLISGFMLWDLVSYSTQDPENKSFEIALSSPKISAGNIVFTAGSIKEDFELDAKALTAEEYAKLTELCEQGKNFSVKARRIGSTRYSDAYYRITELSYRSEYFYTQEEYEEYFRSKSVRNIIIFTAPLPIVWSITLFYIYVAWHPQKFSGKFRRKLFGKYK